MNVAQLVRTELQTLLQDAENSPIGAELKAYVDAQITRIENEVKLYVDEVIAKAFQPSQQSQSQSGT